VYLFMYMYKCMHIYTYIWTHINIYNIYIKYILCVYIYVYGQIMYLHAYRNEQQMKKIVLPPSSNHRSTFRSMILPSTCET
jgi:hypothetical protein